MYTLALRLTALLFFFLLIPQAKAETEPRAIRFGLWPYHSSHFLLNNYQELRARLESRIRQPVVLETAPSIEEFAVRVSRGEYDLALMAPHMARLAQKDYGWRPIARQQMDNIVYVMVGKNSGLDTVRFLKGKRIATPDRNMLMALAAEKALKTYGIKEGDVAWQETGGAPSSLYAVISGKADAAIATLSTLKLSPQEDLDQLKILLDAGKVPQLVIMAGPDFPPYKADAAKAACLSFRSDGKAQFAKVQESEFPSMDSFADQLRRMLAGKLAPARGGKQ